MIEQSKKSGAKVLLFGMQIPPNYGQDYTKQFRDLYPKLARSEGIELLPKRVQVMPADVSVVKAYIATHCD